MKDPVYPNISRIYRISLLNTYEVHITICHHPLYTPLPTKPYTSTRTPFFMPYNLPPPPRTLPTNPTPYLRHTSLPPTKTHSHVYVWCWLSVLSPFTGSCGVYCVGMGSLAIGRVAHYTTLPVTTLNYTALPATTLNYTTRHYTVLHYTTKRSTTLRYSTQHYTTVRSTTLQYAALHYSTQN